MNGCTDVSRNTSYKKDVEWSAIVVKSAVFAALVLAATMISVYTPITEGYFNLGESMVYTAAILGGPYVGLIAGGIGSALADIILGYSHYAPGTLVIKAIEGYLAGWIFLKFSRLPSEKRRSMIYISALLVGGGIALAGAFLYAGLYGGTTELSIWGKTIAFTIPLGAWLMIGAIISVVILYMGIRRDELLGVATLSMLLAGLEMVAGYFIYEATVIYSLGLGEMTNPLAAAAEIPVNLGQVIVGAAIASIVVSSVWRAQK